MEECAFIETKRHAYQFQLDQLELVELDKTCASATHKKDAPIRPIIFPFRRAAIHLSVHFELIDGADVKISLTLFLLPFYRSYC